MVDDTSGHAAGEEGGQGVTYTIGSLFSGVEGFGLGFTRAGFNLRWSVEIDPKCRCVIRRHFPDAEIYDDVTTLDTREIERVDIITYGFPCQDLSVAGKRKGLVHDDGTSTRSGLFFEATRIIRELQPRVAVFENVPGLLSHEGGKTFQTVIDTLGEMGLDTFHCCLDSRFFGVPQRRRRIFGVSTRKIERGLGDAVAGRFAALFTQPQGVRGNPAEGGEARESAPRGAGKLSEGGGGTGLDGVCASVTSKWAKGTGGPSGDECQNLVACGFDPQRKAESIGYAHELSAAVVNGTNPGYHNGVHVHDARGNGDGATSTTITDDHQNRVSDYNAIIIRTANTGANGHGLAKDESHTLDGASGQVLYSIMPMNSGRDYKAREVEITQPLCATQAYGNQGGDLIVATDTASTIRGGGCGGVPSSRGENIVAMSVDQNKTSAIEEFGTLNKPSGGCQNVVAFMQNQRNELRTSDHASPLNEGGGKPGQGFCAVHISRGEGKQVEECPSLMAGSGPNRHGGWSGTDFTAINQNASGELRQSDTAYSVSTNANASGRNTPMVAESVVRRLTERECEALQAFPRNWTEWGVDENGKRVNMSASARYKMMGNAVTVNVVEFIAKRIIKPALDFVDA